MWYCKDCKREFEEPYVWYDDPSPAGIALVAGYYTYTECPYCRSDDIDEFFEEDDE